MGPTATGKTELAIELARRFPFDLISVDSAQVYRGLDIGAAKPSPATLREFPHRLIDILDPSESYSAERFRSDALREMHAIASSGRVPLLVGGTMLYFRALFHGLSVLPAADAGVRATLEAMTSRDGPEALHRRLSEVDPVSAQRIHRNDPQRLQRAVEVFELTGRPLSSFHAEGLVDRPPFRIFRIVCRPTDRARLYQRIGFRLGRMLSQGLVAEVEALRDRKDLDPASPAMRAVGYRQVWRFLDGEYDYTCMAEETFKATRQLAKRQMTWLRTELEADVASTDDLTTESVCLALTQRVFSG
jgi:tRNA dimethylallyltransferase